MPNHSFCQLPPLSTPQKVPQLQRGPRSWRFALIYRGVRQGDRGIAEGTWNPENSLVVQEGFATLA